MTIALSPGGSWSAPDMVMAASLETVKIRWMPRQMEAAMAEEVSLHQSGQTVESGSKAERSRSAIKSWASHGTISSAERRVSASLEGKSIGGGDKRLGACNSFAMAVLVRVCKPVSACRCAVSRFYTSTAAQNYIGST